MNATSSVSLEMAVTAEPQRLPLVRRTLNVMLDGVGLRADTVTDLTMAADAIAELIVSCAERDSPLSCAVTTGEQSTDVTVVGHLATAMTLPTDGMVWRLVEATTEAVSVTTAADGRVEVCCRRDHPLAV
jgi:hypothetical protein